MVKLHELYKLIKKTTPGVWIKSGQRSVYSNQGDTDEVVIDQMNDGIGAGILNDRDRDYILATQPRRLAELLAHFAVRCTECGASGQIAHMINSEFPVMIDCPECKGHGYVPR